MGGGKWGSMHWSRAASFLVLLGLLLPAGCARPYRALRDSAPGSTIVVWEAEDIPASQHNFNGQIYPKDQLYPQLLSGGNWLANWSEKPQAGVSARWSVSVPRTADYHLYARKFWYHGPFEWRFDEGPWHSAARTGLLDHMDLSPLTSVNWAGLGVIEGLAAGKHTFEIRLLTTAEKYVGDVNWGDRSYVMGAAFDCFVLSTEAIFPQGKPDRDPNAGSAEPGFWAFQPGSDDFSRPSDIDLSFLNEKTAGVHGRVRDSGDSFLVDTNGDGKPGTKVRFWGVCVGANAVYMDEGSVDYLADKLAKAGVNLVRVHAPVIDWNADDPKKVDPRYLDRLQYFVSAMKGRGIYTSLSIYFPYWFDVSTLHLSGYADPHSKPWMRIFSDPYLQGIYLAWAEQVLTALNRHSPGGTPLGKDPALLEWEIVNDDSLFSWSFNPGKDLPEEMAAPLAKQFNQWLSAKYGSVAAARTAWQTAGKPEAPLVRNPAPQGAEPAAGAVPLVEAWAMSAEGRPREPAAAGQVADQTWFLATKMYSFYEAMSKSIGAFTRSPATAGGTTYWNPYGGPWDPWSRYGDTACSVMERHCYWPSPDDQPGQDHTKVKVGDTFVDVPAIENALSHPIREYQYDGHQHMVAEYSAAMVNRYRSDSVYLASVYGAVQGTDAICFFFLDSPAWSNTLPKWPVMTPSVFGQFPAFALAYRRGDLDEEEVVVHQKIHKGGQGTITDPDPTAFYVGRVTREFTDEPSSTRQDDISAFSDRERKIVHTKKGHATIAYGDGVAWANVPSFQAATGRLGQLSLYPQPLADVTLADPPDYGCVAVISLGDVAEPIAKAGKVLVQVMTEETNYGWQDVAEGKMRKVVALGSGPLNVRDIHGTITIKRQGNANNLVAKALDANGHQLAGRTVKAKASGNAFTFELLPDVMYYVVQAKGTLQR